MDSQSPSLASMQAVVDLFNQGRHGEAEVLLRDLTQRYPRHGFGWKILGPVLSSQGRTAEALTAMQRAVDLMPNDAEAHYNLGILLSGQGRMAEAAAGYLRALELEPDFANGHNNLGNALYAQGRLAEAAASYRRALALKPDFAMAHNNLGNTLRDRGLLAEAEAGFRRALQLNPDYAEAHANLGNVLRDMQRLAEAEACYRRALQLKPEYAEAHNYLGNVLRDLKRLAEAAECYRRALEINPAYAEAHIHLGNVLRDQGRLPDAEASYRKAVELAPASVDANINLSVVLNTLVPPWHTVMMNDAPRNEAYAAALKSAVTAETRVFEIGTGSGLLAMLAARFGASQVVTCEGVPLIAATAREIVAANGWTPKVSVISKLSTDIEVGADLPRRANLLVSEIVSNELLGEGMLSSIEDAKKRLLEPGAKIIPARSSIVFALFGGDVIRKHVMVDEVMGFDMHRFNAIVSPKRFVYRHDLDLDLLTDPAEAFVFDFVEDDYFPPARRTLRLPITAAGECFGVAQWVRLYLDNHNTFENHPATRSPTAHWQTCLYRFPRPLQVSPGQTAIVSAAHNRTAVWFFLDGVEGQRAS